MKLMIKPIRIIIGVLTIVLMLICALAVVGCTSPSSSTDSSTNTEENTPTMSQYMVNLNVSASKLQTALSEFADAVNSNDTYMMSLKADEAYAVMDQMDAIECPPEMDDVKAKYKEATSELKNALADYLALYIDLDSAQSSDQFNYNDYNSRLEEVQKHYDEGLNLLEEADDMVSKAGGSTGNVANASNSANTSSADSNN